MSAFPPRADIEAFILDASASSSADGMRTRIASRLFTAVRHRDPCSAYELSLISYLNSLFRFLGNFDVNHWNHRVIAFAGFVNRSKTTVFPVIFPVNRE
jgi:hypothetical protein